MKKHKPVEASHRGEAPRSGGEVSEKQTLRDKTKNLLLVLNKHLSRRVRRPRRIAKNKHQGETQNSPFFVW